MKSAIGLLSLTMAIKMDGKRIRNAYRNVNGVSRGPGKPNMAKLMTDAVDILDAEREFREFMMTPTKDLEVLKFKLRYLREHDPCTAGKTDAELEAEAEMILRGETPPDVVAYRKKRKHWWEFWK